MHHLQSWSGPSDTDDQPETKHDEAQVTWYPFPPIPVSSHVAELSHKYALKDSADHSVTLVCLAVVPCG